jgi:hypothetical protein
MKTRAEKEHVPSVRFVSMLWSLPGAPPFMLDSLSPSLNQVHCSALYLASAFLIIHHRLKPSTDGL